MQLLETEAKRVLMPVSGCLAEWSRNAGERGITHTLNPFIGCAIGWSQCGRACYAQHFVVWKRRGHTSDEWGRYVYLKKNAPLLYLKEVGGKPWQTTLGVFMSSVTEPLPPHPEARAVTKAVLEAMVDTPPGRGLIIQTHTSFAASPEIVEVLEELNKKTSVLVSISIETNREHTRGLGKPCCSIEKRLTAFNTLSSRGILTQASISPIMPCDPESFAKQLKDNGCWRVILDHWEIGDGSCGNRTETTGVPGILQDNGYDSKWFSASILDELHPIFVAQRFPGGVGRKENFFALVPERADLVAPCSLN